MDDATRIDAFIARWQGADGRERANYQLFLTELAALLELPAPEPPPLQSGRLEGGWERQAGMATGRGTRNLGPFVWTSVMHKHHNDRF